MPRAPYLLTGNGIFDAETGGQDFGNSLQRFGTSSVLSGVDGLAPFSQDLLNVNDMDLGTGGAMILVDLPSGPVPHLLVGTGTEAKAR